LVRREERVGRVGGWAECGTCAWRCVRNGAQYMITVLVKHGPHAP
jgi:hypothetical protein